MAREIRRTSEFAPTPAVFLELCAQHRSKFADRRSLTYSLISIRQNAEDVLIETGDVKVLVEDEDVPF